MQLIYFFLTLRKKREKFKKLVLQILFCLIFIIKHFTYLYKTTYIWQLFPEICKDLFLSTCVNFKFRLNLLFIFFLELQEAKN